MAGPFGVTPAGFVRKDLQTILDEFEQQQRNDISPGLNQEADALAGQLNAVMGNATAELWEVAEAVYNSQYPDTSGGTSLDNVSAITGTTRRGETESTVICDVDIDGGFTLLKDSVCFDPDRADDTRFLLDEDIENTGGSPAIFSVSFTAESAGATVANAGTLIGGPELVTGWNSCTNPLDADVGTEVELDPPLRFRREEEVAGQGGSTTEAIRADVRKVEGVLSTSVLENFTEFTDANGVPAKSFEVIVQGGADADIAQAIFDTKPSGIRPFGSTIVPVIDSEGESIDIAFTRPTVLDIFLEIDLDKDPAEYPDPDGDDQVKAATVTRGAAQFNQGQDVVLTQLNGSFEGGVGIFSVAGVKDVTEIRAGFSISPAGTANLPIAVREIADFDTSRIVVASSDFVEA